MTSGPLSPWGVVPTGFHRKDFNTILLEIESAMVTEFGPNVIQTPQSRFGQVNGLMAFLITQLWEFAEGVYQSYDIDQAEGARLDELATLRLMERSLNEDDATFRRAITNQGRARVDVSDFTRALQGLDGVTFVQVWIPDNADTPEQRIPAGYISVAILGGDDTEIAAVMREYVVPGISTYGDTTVSATIDGYCRSMLILRPILVPVRLVVNVRVGRDLMGCPPPSLVAIRDTLIADLNLRNGDDLTYFRIRSTIEAAFPNVEVVGFTGARDELEFGYNETIVIGFVEMATLAPADVVIEPVAPSATQLVPPFIAPAKAPAGFLP